MGRPTRLTDEQILRRLEARPGWARDGDHLRRSFSFPDFARAFGFMAAAAVVAERMNHHPEWFNVYNRVDVGLSTHDAGGITELDFALAAAMDELAD